MIIEGETYYDIDVEILNAETMCISQYDDDCVVSIFVDKKQSSELIEVLTKFINGEGIDK